MTQTAANRGRGDALPRGRTLSQNEVESMKAARGAPFPGSGKFDTKHAITEFAATVTVDVNQFPFGTIVYVAMHRGNGLTDLCGTGFFVGSRVIVTAAHNLPYSGSGIVNLSVTVRLDGSFNDPNCQTYDPHDWHSSNSFVLGSPGTDYGVIVLKESVGDVVGWFDLWAIPDNIIHGFNARIDGYPETSNSQTCVDTQLVGLASANDRLAYVAGTDRGQSGGPVWDPATNRVIGIHTYEDAAQGYDIATRITEPVKAWIRSF